MSKSIISSVAICAALLASGSAQAGAIRSAVAGTVNSGGPGFGTLTETFNQAGLSAGYLSGVTDFDTYIGTNPTHTIGFAGFEWFSNSGTNSASVTYDLGASFNIDAMALWNEESSGIGLLDLLVSNDGVNFSALLAGLAPADNPVGSSYGAEVFNFGSTSFRYMRMDMSRCPQAPSTFTACAIGEVAFREASSNDVPEPAALGLVLAGLAAAGVVGRRRRG
jgi:hypothetical protein